MASRLRNTLILIGCLVLLVLFSGYSYFSKSKNGEISINDYESCVRAGNPVMESFPERCVAKDGRTFTRVLSEAEKSKLNSATPSATPSLGKEIGFEVINLTKGVVNEKKDTKKNYVIKSIAEWKNLVVSPAPAIDFNKDMVIAVLMGQVNNGGFSVKVNKVIEKESNLEVFVKETSPGKDCVVTMAIEFPYQVVKLNKIDKQVIFNIEQEVKPCD